MKRPRDDSVSDDSSKAVEAATHRWLTPERVESAHMFMAERAMRGNSGCALVSFYTSQGKEALTVTPEVLAAWRAFGGTTEDLCDSVLGVLRSVFDGFTLDCRHIDYCGETFTVHW